MILVCSYVSCVWSRTIISGMNGFGVNMEDLAKPDDEAYYYIAKSITGWSP